MGTTNIYLLVTFFFCSLVVQQLHVKDSAALNATTRIVYAHGKKKNSNIFTIKPDGSDRQITSGTVDSKHPNWSRSLQSKRTGE